RPAVGLGQPGAAGLVAHARPLSFERTPHGRHPRGFQQTHVWSSALLSAEAAMRFSLPFNGVRALVTLPCGDDGPLRYSRDEASSTSACSQALSKVSIASAASGLPCASRLLARPNSDQPLPGLRRSSSR